MGNYPCPRNVIKHNRSRLEPERNGRINSKGPPPGSGKAAPWFISALNQFNRRPQAYGSGGPTLMRKNCTGNVNALVSVHWKGIAGELVMKSVLQFTRFEDACTA